jgi:hypothetical protein
MECYGHFLVPHFKDKLENVFRLMARMATGNHLKENDWNYNPRGKKICGDIVAIAKYLKVLSVKQEIAFACFVAFPSTN